MTDEGLTVIEMSMSLDGFVAGPDDSAAHPLGLRGGPKVFDWLGSGDRKFPLDTRLPIRPAGASRSVIAEAFARFGAYVSGKRTYLLANKWGGQHPAGVPTFILTHDPDPDPPGDGKGLIFVTDGIESAIRRAKTAAAGRDVCLIGASPGQQALKAGLVDEVFVHVAPILIGTGVRLFEHLGDREIELELIDSFGGPDVSHLRYRVRP